MSLFKNIGRSS